MTDFAEEVKQLRSILLLAEEHAKKLERKEHGYSTLRSVCQNFCASNVGWQRKLNHLLKEMEMLECVGQGRLFVPTMGEV